jgi:hypothetical protein
MTPPELELTETLFGKLNPVTPTNSLEIMVVVLAPGVDRVLALHSRARASGHRHHNSKTSGESRSFCFSTVVRIPKNAEAEYCGVVPDCVNYLVLYSDPTYSHQHAISYLHFYRHQDRFPDTKTYTNADANSGL